MKYPFVSVAVVALNAERTIEECLTSLINLNYPKEKYEILLIDGKSTDNTVKIAKNFKKVKIFYNKNKIISAGRNIAIEKSKGQYLAFTDADCKTDKNWLNNLVSLLLKSNNSVAAVGGPNLIFDNDPKLAKVIGYMQETWLGSGGSPQSYKIGEIREVYSLANCNVIYKKNILKKYLYDERINIGEDCELNFRLKKNKLKLIYTNNAKVLHHRRNSLGGFIKNMFLYGETQARISKINKRLIRIYSVFPSLTILAIILAPFLILTSDIIFWIYLSLGIIYIALLTASSAYVVENTGLSGVTSVFLLPLQHVSYGLGFVWGLVR